MLGDQTLLVSLIVGVTLVGCAIMWWTTRPKGQ